MRSTTRRNLLRTIPLGLSAGLASRAYAAPPRADVRITKFVTHKVRVDGRELLFLEVQTNAGITGIGEGSLPSRANIVEEAIRWLEPHFVGRDPSGVEEHWDRTYYRTNRWRYGAVLLTAQSAVDIALWDIEGKVLGVPVWRLLGGPLHRSLRVYYSHWDSKVSPRTPEALARHAIATREQGWTAVKIIPQRGANGADTIAKLVAELKAIREAVGDSLEIGLELVERFSTRSAIELARAVAPYRPMFLEEATIRENPQAMTELAEKSPVPLAGGEGMLDRYDFRRLLDAKGAAIIQPDVIHCGGITEMRKIASLAEVYGAELAPHQWYGPIAHVASLAVASVCRNFLMHEWDAAREEPYQALTNGTFPAQSGGAVTLPGGPGIGLEIDFAEFKKRYPFDPA